MHVLLLALIAAFSLAANLHLHVKLKKLVKEPAPTLEAKELLANLMQGTAVIQIRVLNPENLIYRSPRR